jgi:hypothetical protein
MFTRDEALALWDDLVLEEEAFLYTFGELVMSRTRKVGGLPISMIPGAQPHNSDLFGYFIRARNHTYTKEMFEAYNRVCERHQATYRIQVDGPLAGIIFFKAMKKEEVLPEARASQKVW